MHSLESPCGTVVTENAWLDKEIIREVMVEDAYRLRKLATVYTPKVIFDIGSGFGAVSMLCQQLWPDAKITAFEASFHTSETAKKNLKNVMVVENVVGYALTAKRLTERYGFADLVICDCEGGEVPFFYDLYTMGMLQRFPVIVGEYHHLPARRMLEACFEQGYHRKFIDPAEGAGYWQTFFAISQSLPISIAQGWGI